MNTNNIDENNERKKKNKLIEDNVNEISEQESEKSDKDKIS